MVSICFCIIFLLDVALTSQAFIICRGKVLCIVLCPIVIFLLLIEKKKKKKKKKKHEKKYENLLLMGDFNLQPSEVILTDFMENYELYSLVKVKTCFKSTQGSCIDLILTNTSSFFQKTDVFETGLSDFHLLVYTLFKSSYVRQPPKRIVYRNYSHFDRSFFLNELKSCLDESHTANEYSTFQSILTSVLDKHAPLKTRLIRGNSKSYMSKTKKCGKEPV